jgi:AcrR family transcriptional regulator
VSALLADPPESRSIEQRALDATLTCIARHGLGKITVDDIASEAGCARATLYRYFGGKQELVAAAVAAEATRVTERLQMVAARADSLEDVLFSILTTAADELSRNEALQFVSTHEPERLLPELTFSGGDRFLATAGTALEPCLAPYVPAERLPRAAEWVARVALGLLFSPASPLSLGDLDHTRAYVRDFILPALQPEPAPVSTLPKG